MTIPTRCGGAGWSEEDKAAYRREKKAAEYRLQWQREHKGLFTQYTQAEQKEMERWVAERMSV